MNFCFSSFYRKVSQPCSAQQYLPPQSGRGSPPQQQRLTRVTEAANVGQARCHSFCKGQNQEGLLPWDPTSPSQERASPLLSHPSSSPGHSKAGSWPWGWRAARRPRGRGSPLVPLLRDTVGSQPIPSSFRQGEAQGGVPPGGLGLWLLLPEGAPSRSSPGGPGTLPAVAAGRVGTRSPELTRPQVPLSAGTLLLSLFLTSPLTHLGPS